jgi:hypothetical protein
MKKYSGLLATIAVSTTLQASHTHFGVKFSIREHEQFAADAGYRNTSKYTFFGNRVNGCEEGEKERCTKVIKQLSKLITINRDSYLSLNRSEQFNKYGTLLRNLEERNLQIEQLEAIPEEELITSDDIRTIFKKLKPSKSPYDDVYNSPVYSSTAQGYYPETGEIDNSLSRILKLDAKKIVRCKVFKINKSHSDCRYWNNLLDEAQHTIKDDQKLIDKLQRLASLREY